LAAADEFRQYAEEALRWAAQSKDEKEKQALIDLARTWMQAAVKVEIPIVSDDKPHETGHNSDSKHRR
jgi:hypothetical protein